MLYYRVPQGFDNSRVIRHGKDNILRYTDIFLVGKALYTDQEIQKMRATYFRTYRCGSFLLRDEIFEPVQVSKKKVYWFFGFRFADDKVIKR